MTPPSRRDVVAGAGSLALGSLVTAVRGSAQAAAGETMFVKSGNISGPTGSIRALDAKTGIQYWERATGPVRATPIVVDGTLYTSDFEVIARSAATGASLWRRRVPGSPVRTSPTVVGDSVYLADQSVTVLDRSDGSIRWSDDYGTGALASPSVVDGSIYLRDNRGTVLAVDAADGTEEWRYSLPNSQRIASTVGGDTVFVTSSGGEMVALDSRTGTERWHRRPGTGPLTPPVLIDPLVIVGSADGAIYAIDGVTGDRVWLFSTGAPVRGPLTVAGDHAYATSLNGFFFKLHVQEGVGEWDTEVISEGSVAIIPTAVEATGHVVLTYQRINEPVTVFESYGIDDGVQRWLRTIGTPAGVPPTFVTDPEAGDSVDSRALSDLDGHHDAFATRSASLSFADVETADEGGAGLHFAAGAGGMAGAAYLLYRYRSRRNT